MNLSFFVHIALLLLVLLGPVSFSFVNTENYTASIAFSTVTAQTDVSEITIGTYNKDLEDFCSKNPGTWFTNCIVETSVNASSRFLILSAGVFDYFLWFTLDNEVLGSEVVNKSWSNMRDVANMAFILGLIYISFSLILGFGAAGAKKLVVKLILIGLVLNFSLFATQVIIDAGNITALTFYNEIKTASPHSAIPTNGLFDPKGVELKSISGALVQSFNPARILESDTFSSIVSSSEAGGDKVKIWGVIFVLYLAFTIMNVMGAWQIIKASFTFISRTMWLIILSILSPLAFVAMFLPEGNKYFRKWFTALVDRCFCLVVYLFFIWLLILLLEGANAALSSSSSGAAVSSWKEMLLTVVIQFVIVYSVLKIAGDRAKKMCEGGMGVGDFAANITKKGAGLALGVATGGTGLVARRAIGRTAYNAVEGNNAVGRRLGAMVQSNSGVAKFMGNIGIGAADRIQGKKFGLSEGYKGVADKAADRDVKVANRVGNVVKNVNKKEAEKKYERRYVEQGKSPEEAKSEAKSRVKAEDGVYKKQGIDAGRAYLKNRTDGATGAMVSILNGLVPDAAGEALRRYGSKEKEAAEKLEKQNILSNFANGIAALYAQQGAKLKTATATGAEEVKDKIKQGAAADDVLASTSVVDVKKQAEDVLSPVTVNQSNGEVETLPDTQITKNTKKKMKETFDEDIARAVGMQKQADTYKQDFGAISEMAKALGDNIDQQDKVLSTLEKMADKFDAVGMNQEKETLRQKITSITSGTSSDTALAELDLDAISSTYETALAQKVESSERSAALLVDQAFGTVEETTSKSLAGKSAMARNMAQAQYRSVSDESAKAQETLGDNLATSRDQFADDGDTGVQNT